MQVPAHYREDADPPSHSIGGEGTGVVQDLVRYAVPLPWSPQGRTAHILSVIREEHIILIVAV
jgi:hypothetical protein